MMNMEDNSKIIRGDKGFKAFIENIAVIVVLYKTTLEEVPAFVSLNKSIALFENDIKLDYYVFDNSPEPIYNNKEKLNALGIKYKYDSTNPGLSKPSNEGAKIAAEQNKEWLLFTNPDTLYEIDFFEKLYSAYLANPRVKLFAPILISNTNIVSPSQFNFFIGTSPKMVKSGINDLNKKLILYSGMFVSLPVFFEVGGFNDNIKLDFMDCYFSENYRKAYGLFYLLNSECQHDLSSYETDVNKVLNRFKYYCEGAKYFASSKLNYIILFFICLLRAIKLSVRLRNSRFSIIVFKVFISQKVNNI